MTEGSVVTSEPEVDVIVVLPNWLRTAPASCTSPEIVDRDHRFEPLGFLDPDRRIRGAGRAPGAETEPGTDVVGQVKEDQVTFKLNEIGLLPFLQGQVAAQKGFGGGLVALDHDAVDNRLDQRHAQHAIANFLWRKNGLRRGRARRKVKRVDLIHKLQQVFEGDCPVDVTRGDRLQLFGFEIA